MPPITANPLFLSALSQIGLVFREAAGGQIQTVELKARLTPLLQQIQGADVLPFERKQADRFIRGEIDLSPQKFALLAETFLTHGDHFGSLSSEEESSAGYRQIVGPSSTSAVPSGHPLAMRPSVLPPRSVASPHSRSPRSTKSADLDATTGERQKNEGEWVRTAVIFTDFSKFSNKAFGMPANLVLRRLNEYFGAMVPELKKFGGIRDKYIGDAIMGYFTGYVDNELRAVRAAVAMQEAAKRLCDKLKKRTLESGAMREELKRRDKNLSELDQTEIDQIIAKIDPLIFDTRIGIHKGKVIRGELGADDEIDLTIIGDIVNFANRMESVGRLGGVALSEEMYNEVQHFVAADKNLEKPKGFDQPVTVYHLTNLLPPELVQEPHEKIKLEFAGRDGELGEVLDLFESTVREKRSCSAMIEGGAGEGKSRLKNEALRRMRELHPDIEVVSGRGEHLPHVPPNSVIVEALRNLALIRSDDTPKQQERKIQSLVEKAFHGLQEEVNNDERIILMQLIGYFLGVNFEALHPQVKRLIDNDDPTELGQEIYDALLKIFKGLSAQAPLVIVIDDMQWADSGTKNFLYNLLNDLKDCPIMFMPLRRPEPFSEDEPPWFQESADRPRLFKSIKINLHSLSENILESMVDHILGPGIDPKVRELLSKRSQGNPFFLQVMASALQEHWRFQEDPVKGPQLVSPDGSVDVPLDASKILQAQIEGLEDREKKLLKAASVIGHEFSLSDLRALGVSDPEKIIEGLEQRGYLSRLEDRYQFIHDLFRSAAYERIEDPIPLHAQYAEYLRKSGSKKFAVIAAHFESGNRAAEASEFYHEAAEEAFFEKTQLDAAVKFYRKAFDLTPHLSKKFEVLRGWDEALYLSGAYREQEEIHDLSEEVIERMDERVRDPADLAGVQYRIGRSLHKRGHYQQAEQHLTEALTIIENEAGAQILKGVILIHLATNFVHIGQYQKAKELYEHAEIIAREIEDDRLIGRALMGGDYVAGRLGDYSRKLDATREAVRRFIQCGDTPRLMTAYTSQGSILTNLGAYEEAELTLKETLALVSKFGGKRQSAEPLYSNIARVAQLQGRQDEAIRIIEERLTGNPEVIYVAYCHVYLALAYIANHQFNRALESARKSLETALSMDDRESEAMARMVLAQIYLEQGINSKASEESEIAVKLFEALGGIEEFDLEILLTRAKVLMQNNHHQEAWMVIDRAKKLLDQRAAKITDEKHQRYRESLLTRVEINKELARLWQILRKKTHGGLDPKTEGHLARLDFYPSSQFPEEIKFMEGMKINEIVKDDEKEHITTAGIVIDIPIATVFESLIKNVVSLDKNPGQIDGVWAEKIRLEPFYAQDGTVYAVVDWNIASTLRLHKIVFPLIGQPSHRRELLKDRIYSRDGIVFIELKRADETAVLTETGAIVKIDPELRPGRHQFGHIKFVLAPTIDHKTVLVLEMGRALFTENPEKLLQAIVKGISE